MVVDNSYTLCGMLEMIIIIHVGFSYFKRKKTRPSNATL